MNYLAAELTKYHKKTFFLAALRRLCYGASNKHRSIKLI